jgi:hypothetical protein
VVIFDQRYLVLYNSLGRKGVCLDEDDTRKDKQNEADSQKDNFYVNGSFLRI